MTKETHEEQRDLLTPIMKESMEFLCARLAHARNITTTRINDYVAVITSLHETMLILLANDNAEMEAEAMTLIAATQGLLKPYLSKTIGVACTEISFDIDRKVKH